MKRASAAGKGEHIMKTDRSKFIQAHGWGILLWSTVFAGGIGFLITLGILTLLPGLVSDAFRAASNTGAFIGIITFIAAAFWEIIYS